MRTLAFLAFPFLVATAVTACSDGSPLGGPYGGTSDPPAPNRAQNSADPSDPSASSDPATSDSTDPTNPTAPTTGADSGTKKTVVDSGAAQQQPTQSGTDASVPQQQSATPTWTQIWTAYLAAGTKGNCGKSSCHSQMSTASGAYKYLQGRGQINGTSSALVDPNSSDLTWYGGNMPKGGSSSYPAAQTDLEAWVAAGALNN